MLRAEDITKNSNFRVFVTTQVTKLSRVQWRELSGLFQKKLVFAVELQKNERFTLRLLAGVPN